MSESENEALIRIAQKSVVASGRHCMIEGVPCSIGNDGSIEPIGSLHAIMKARADGPLRRQGTSHHTELDSFIDHINRMKESSTTIWADVERCLFTAIYNYDPEGAEPGSAGWCDHRAKYLCPLSPEWKAWIDQQNEWMSQDEFAQWIDSRMEDLIDSGGMPKPIELLEMSRNLQIYTNGTHTKKIDPTTGQYALICKEEHTSESTKIPRAFMAALRIFEGGEQRAVEIRLQFRMTNGRAMFCFTVHRHTEHQRDAFGEMRTVIAERTDRPVFAGRHD